MKNITFDKTHDSHPTRIFIHGGIVVEIENQEHPIQIIDLDIDGVADAELTKLPDGSRAIVQNYD